MFYYGLDFHDLPPDSILHISSFIVMCEAFLHITSHFGLYRHRKGLGLHKVGYKGGDIHIRIAKLAFHAKESPFRTWDEVFNLVSS